VGKETEPCLLDNRFGCWPNSWQAERLSYNGWFNSQAFFSSD
jgi:hypothetical protein